MILPEFESFIIIRNIYLSQPFKNKFYIKKQILIYFIRTFLFKTSK